MGHCIYKKIRDYGRGALWAWRVTLYHVQVTMGQADTLLGTYRPCGLGLLHDGKESLVLLRHICPDKFPWNVTLPWEVWAQRYREQRRKARKYTFCREIHPYTEHGFRLKEPLKDYKYLSPKDRFYSKPIAEVVLCFLQLLFLILMGFQTRQAASFETESLLVLQAVEKLKLSQQHNQRNTLPSSFSPRNSLLGRNTVQSWKPCWHGFHGSAEEYK